MNYEDTVMKIALAEGLAVNFNELPIYEQRNILHQAKVSFKAGQESRCDWHKPLPVIISESFSEGKKVGYLEGLNKGWLDVVEFLDEIGWEPFDDYEGRPPPEWAAKKKDWGITIGWPPEGLRDTTEGHKGVT